MHTLYHTHRTSISCLQGLIFTILRHIKQNIIPAVTAELPYSGILPFFAISAF